jgi:hypothetical protein
VYEEPAPLLRANPDLPREVERVIRRALSKNPEQRFASCGAFVDTLGGGLFASRADPKDGAAEIREQQAIPGDPQRGMGGCGCAVLLVGATSADPQMTG